MNHHFLFAKENLDRFVQNLNTGLFRFFDFNSIEKSEHDAFMQLFIGFANQVLLEDAVDELERMLKVKVLYATKTTDGQEYFAVAYSAPKENKMYVLFINSCEFGIANYMVAHFYDSMDIMFEELSKLLINRINKGTTLEITSRMELIKDFFS